MVKVDVCIVGAGPVGGALACRLAQAGVEVAVVDRAPLPPMEHPDFDGRAFAIAEGSRALLDDGGVWPALPLPANPITAIRVSDGRLGRPASPLHLHFDLTDAGLPPADEDESDRQAFGWMVEARSLRVALNGCLAAAPLIQVFAPAEAAVSRDAQGATVAIAGGPVIACRLVVAAEGRESPLRRAAGIAVTRLPYRQSGIVGAVAHERPHRNVALEHFLPAGPFAQLPMAASDVAPHLSAIVWTEETARAERMMALDETAFAAEIGRRLGPHLGALRPVGRRWLYRLGALHAHRYHDVRLVLVGDAAHAIHPIAGQGLNLGLRDAACLAELVIETLQAGGDPGAPALLARYQRLRRPDNLLMLATTDALDRLFSSANPLLRAARRLGIAAVHRTPPLKRVFVRQAMGLTPFG